MTVRAFGTLHHLFCLYVVVNPLKNIVLLFYYHVKLLTCLFCIYILSISPQSAMHVNFELSDTLSQHSRENFNV